MICSAEHSNARLKNSGSFGGKKAQSYPMKIKLLTNRWQKEGAQTKRILWKFPSDCALAQP